MPAPSAMTNPSRVASNGREGALRVAVSVARARASSRSRRGRSGVIARSPCRPRGSASASPRRISSAASPIACEPVAQAETIGVVRTPARRARSRAGPSPSPRGRRPGRTVTSAPRPRSRRTSCCCRVWLIRRRSSRPRRRPAPARSRSSRRRERLLRGRDREEDRAVEPPDLLRRDAARRVEVLDLAGDRDREVARVERADLSIPLSPATRRSQVDSQSFPTGVTAPMPVIATRRIPW